MVAGWSRRSASARCSPSPALLARAPGHGDQRDARRASLLIVAAAAVCSGGSRVRGAGRAARAGLPVALVVALVLSIPFAVSGRWGLLGVGFNNDLGLHLAWAEWLRSGFGPAPDAGYPLGPHGLAVAIAALPGIGLGQAFVGEIFAIGILTGADRAGGALRDLGPARRVLAAALVAVPYLGRLLLRPGRLQGDRRGALRPRLRRLPARPPARRAAERPLAAAAAWPLPLPGPGRRHLLLLQLRRARLAGRDRRPLEPDPAGGAAGAARRGRCCASCCGRRRCWRSLVLAGARRRR